MEKRDTLPGNAARSRLTALKSKNPERREAEKEKKNPNNDKKKASTGRNSDKIIFAIVRFSDTGRLGTTPRDVNERVIKTVTLSVNFLKETLLSYRLPEKEL
jgi:hypothetical protein